MNTKSEQLADKLFPIAETNDDLPIIDIPPENRRLATESYDFSISTLVDYLAEEAMVIPEYQRKYVWNRAQASRLIESLIIQCPIPVIYLNQEQDEKLSVVDGNQRLMTIKTFVEGGFPLRGLTTYPELEGSYFQTLDPRFQRHILNRTLRCIVIKKETHPQIKFDVFERLNTGSVRLNYQELRHGMFHGPLIDLLDRLASSRAWKKVSKTKSDTRMKGQETILRYIALADSHADYKKPMSTFLNNFCERHKSIDEASEGEIEEKFYGNLAIANELLGELAFRQIDEKFKPITKQINAALFDATMVALHEIAPSESRVAECDRDALVTDLRNALKEEKLHTSISVGTSATANVRLRLREIKKVFKRHL